jgi:type II secretory ATPase GspE/PulE/Tfp pilus assembly ATPase PilB-like protein
VAVILIIVGSIAGAIAWYAVWLRREAHEGRYHGFAITRISERTTEPADALSQEERRREALPYMLVAHAINQGAEEIRLTPSRNRISVSYLVNGEWTDPPADGGEDGPLPMLFGDPIQDLKARWESDVRDLMEHLKLAANVPYHDHRQPQKGQLRITYGNALYIADTSFDIRDDGEEVTMKITRTVEDTASKRLPDIVFPPTSPGAVHLSEPPPIVRVTTAILADALYRTASAISFEPKDDEIFIALLLDGVWEHYLAVPRHTHLPMFRRLKVMAAMPYYAQVWPQVGQFTVFVDQRPYEMQLTFEQTANGEKATIKISGPTELQEVASDAA